MLATLLLAVLASAPPPAPIGAATLGESGAVTPEISTDELKALFDAGTCP